MQNLCLATLAAFVGLGACTTTRAPAQLLVEVTSDYRPPDECSTLVVEVVDVETQLTKEASFSLASGQYNFPISFGVVPGYSDQIVDLRVRLYQEERVVVQQTIRTGFERWGRKDIQVFLAKSCESVWNTCASSETCKRGICKRIDGEDDERDAGGLTCEEERFWYRDEDGDSYGSAVDSVRGCIAPDGYVDNADDCDDSCGDCAPGRSEVCDDELDNDCQGGMDDGCDCEENASRRCGGTNEGACEYGEQVCQDGRWSECAGEIAATVEVCDSIDNDCDTSTDEGVLTVYYLDNDADGYGSSTSVSACQGPAGYANRGGDCDDERITVSPSGSEECDMLDNDCDGTTDESARCGSVSHGTTQCISGQCSFTCDAHYDDCDESITNGCETDLWTSDLHCGRCGNACDCDGAGQCESMAGWCSTSLCEISLVDAPTARQLHSAVWSGSEMIVKGGYDGGGSVGLGGQYDLASNSWTLFPSRTTFFDHSAVWADMQEVVWGGMALIANTRGGYTPSFISSWTQYPTTIGAPSARSGHTAIWTGTEMIVFGGNSSTGFENTGGRWDAFSDAWTSLSAAGAPAARYAHSAIWTGTEMIVWGGQTAGGRVDNGARYDPETDSWTRLSSTGAPSARSGHSAVWTGQEMIVWGGYDVTGVVDTGGRYDPVLDRWSPLATGSTPSARADHTAVWTGVEMIVWGGYSGDGDFVNNGWVWRP